MEQFFSAGDAPKLAIFILICVAFYMVARWSSNRSEGAQPFQPPSPEADPPPQAQFLPVDEKSVTRVAPSSKNQTISLKDIWFDNFNVEVGPPDPKRFCAEMNVTITISDFEERTWEATYLVATPEGMRDRMQNEHWSTMFMPGLLVVSQYDINQICEAIIDQLRGDDPDATPPPEDSSLDSVGR